MKKILLSVLLIFSVAILFSQNFNLKGAGARAAGMGGAFIAVADDATAITWNPAGLTQLERPEVSVVTKFTDHEINYENTATNLKNKTTLSYMKLNFLSGVFPINSSFVVSASAQDQLDFENRVQNQNYDYEESGSANTFNLGAGFKLVPAFSIGLAFNKWYGGYKYQNYLDGYKATMDVSGTNVGAGMLLDFSQTESKIPLKFGLSYKKPFTLVLRNKNYRYDIDMPGMLGLGTSLRIGQNFTVAFDYEIRPFKKRRVKDANGNWDYISYYNLNQFRFGMEYLIVTDFAVLPLRVGAFNEPTTGTVNDDNGNPKKQIVNGGISLGTGLIFQRFSLDIAVSYAGSETKVNTETLTQGRGEIISSLIVYF